MGTESSVLLAAFRERLLNDRLDGQERALAYYQGLFPGFEDVIAAEYRRLQQLASGDTAAGTPEVAADLSDSRQIGPFLVKRELGQGGQGVVYLATDTRLGRAVALKVLSRRVFDSSQQLRRFHREAALAARLHHPSIATVYEAGATDREVFVAMEYVEGASLRTEIDAEKGAARLLSRAAVLARVRSFAEVVRAVHVAHEAGVLHRDLKPSNLLRTPQGSLKVLDFGLARDLHEEGELTRTGDVFGSPAYMAPEQIEGRILDERSDVFSLGVTLYEWLTGERPFRGATRQALFQAILRDEPPDPRKRCPALPGDLRVVLATAMARDLRDRYQTAQDFARDLQAVVEGRPVAVVPLRPWQRFARWTQRDPRRASLVLGLVVAFAGAAACAGFLVARRSVWEEGRRSLQERETEELVAQAFGYDQDLPGFQTRERLLGALQRNPELALVRMYLASDAVVHGRSDEALELIDTEPTGEDQAVAFARIRDAVAGVPLATEEARPLGHVEQYTAGALLVMGAYRQGTGQDIGAALEGALWHLQNAILLSPKAELLLHLSYAQTVCLLVHFNDLEGREEGVRIAEALASLWPQSSVAMSWAAQAASYADVARGKELPGKEFRAEELLRRAVELDPNNVNTLSNLAVFLLWDRRLEEAEECYARLEDVLARGAWPAASWRDHVFYGSLLAEYGYSREAEVALGNAVAGDPPLSVPYFHLAKVKLDLGKLPEARDLVERARQHVPGQDAYYEDVPPAELSALLREILRRQGDQSALRQELEQEVAAHPEDGAAALEYGRLLVEEGRPEDAWLVVDQALGHLPADAAQSLRDDLLQLQSEIDS